MNLSKLIDHTLLRANACEADIRKLCAEARDYEFYSVCVNPRWVAFCRTELSGSPAIPITVAGFPLGANVASVKAREVERALSDGAMEIDMVLDFASVFDHDWKKVEEEIKLVSRACDRIPLKVIIETAYLSKEEIREVSKCCLFGGAHFVKTSSGFAPQGAKEEDVRLIREIVHPNLGVKASGGINSWAEAERMLAAGATRLGSSMSVLIMEEWKRTRG